MKSEAKKLCCRSPDESLQRTSTTGTPKMYLSSLLQKTWKASAGGWWSENAFSPTLEAFEAAADFPTRSVVS